MSFEKVTWKPDFYIEKYESREKMKNALGIGLLALNQCILKKRINKQILSKLESTWGRPMIEIKEAEAPMVENRKAGDITNIKPLTHNPITGKFSTKERSLSAEIYKKIEVALPGVFKICDLAEKFGYSESGMCKALKRRYGETNLSKIKNMLGIYDVLIPGVESDEAAFRYLAPIIDKVTTHGQLIDELNSTIHLTNKILKNLFGCQNLEVIRSVLGMESRNQWARRNIPDSSQFDLIKKHLDSDDHTLETISKKTGFAVGHIGIYLFGQFGTKDISKIQKIRGRGSRGYAPSIKELRLIDKFLDKAGIDIAWVSEKIGIKPKYINAYLFKYYGTSELYKIRMIRKGLMKKIKK